MNVLIVGGSNSRLKTGYTSSLRSKLELLGCQIDTFTNISLGANTCLLGIVSLLDLKDGISYDIVVLEYSVNDYSMVARGDWSLWRASYEGIVRKIFRLWPASKLCCVLLGRSNVDAILWDRQINETKSIAKHYNAIVCDAQYCVPLSIEGDSVYADPMHYSQLAQDFTGNLAAKLICDRDKCASNIFPQAFYDSVFDKVAVLDISTLGTGKKRIFSTSIVKIEALELGISDSFEVDIPGQLVCVMFVSKLTAKSFFLKCSPLIV